jgi:5-methylthioadenosine/S-adenosylhomocysteine deaminase
MQNITHLDPTLLTAEHALEMATIRAAKALGLEDDIGSIEVGKKADIAIFDLGKAHATVGNRPVAALVFSAHGTDADTVIVNGRVLLQHGELVDVPHEQQILTEATARAAEVIERAGLADQVFRHWRPTSW